MRGVDTGAEPDAAADSPDAPPTAVPAASGPVQTRGLATVLDAGDGPQLCLGAVAESFPPQCSGLPIAGWDWARAGEGMGGGGFEEANGVRWGSYHLTGTFDGTTFTVSDSIPAALYDAMSTEPEAIPGTPCPEPEGGWAPVDPAKTTPEAMDAAFNTALGLEGYAGAWMDQSQDPAAANDPAKVIINVAVTGDTEEAERRLREVWGGSLCVSQAHYTEAELNELSIELQERLPGILTTSGGQDVVRVDVVHDDGSLQAWVDEEYGDGVVEVTSALVPAE